MSNEEWENARKQLVADAVANTPPSSVTLQGVAADTHRELQAAARKVEEANAVLTAAQADFRKALAAHMAAITGAKVEP